MSNERQIKSEGTPTLSLVRVIVSLAATVLVVGFLLGLAVFALTPPGQAAGKWLSWFFALDTVQLWWYVTRASGLVAYLLLWFSMVLGLGVTSKFLDRLLDRVFTYDFHQFISLLSIAFVVLHVVVLMVDRYMPYSIWQVLVPFISPYRPFWVGVGVIGFYLIALVTVTFYLRSRIGMKAFRVIHYLSLISYIGATLHGFFAGTDSSLLSVMGLYASTFLVVVFLTVYWIVMGVLKSAEKRAIPVQPAAPSRPVARQTASRF